MKIEGVVTAMISECPFNYGFLATTKRRDLFYLKQLANVHNMMALSILINDTFSGNSFYSKCRLEDMFSYSENSSMCTKCISNEVIKPQ